MRILIVTDWIGEEGGLETYLRQLVPGLARDGHDVRLLVSSVGSAAATADYVAVGHTGQLAQALTLIANPSAVRTIRRVEAEWRPDVIHASMVELQLSPAVLLAARAPIVLNVVWYKPTCPTGHRLLPTGAMCRERAGRVCIDSGCINVARAMYDAPRYALLRRAYGRAAAAVSCSAFMSAELARWGIETTPLGWPVEPLVATPDRCARTADPTVVACGRLSPEKGIDVLVRAVARLRERGIGIRARLVGDGPSRPALEELARREGIADAVEFTGWLSHAEAQEALVDAWALVAPSVWAEPLGLGAIEAILAGIPVVASAVGGYAETVEPGRTGLLVPNGDVDALVDALWDIASRRTFPNLGVDPEARETLRHRHDPRRHLDELVPLLEKAAGA